MHNLSSDPAQPQAWGDVNLPDEAQHRADTFAGPGGRQSQRDEAPSHDTSSEGAERDPTLREDTNEYAFGATTQQPAVGPGYATLPLGPGNEAMVGGASPAPRGYTGGAMGKVNAKLSPNFAQAALGDPPPWEAPILSPADAARLSMIPAGARPPSAGRSPEDPQSPVL